MRKLLCLLMLIALFVSCSSDDNTDPDDGNGKNKNMIDEKILGKWRVEYAKSICAFFPYAPTSGKLFYKISEYNGDYDGTKETMPNAGLFNSGEIGIEFDKEGGMKVNYVVYKDPHWGIVEEKTATTNYQISNDSIQLIGDYPLKVKYYIDNKNKLIIERPYFIWKGDPAYSSEFLPENEGILFSKYSKITE